MKKFFWWFWIVFNFLIGAALGVLVVGGYFGVNKLFFVVLSSIIFGLGNSFIWFVIYKKQQAGKNRSLTILKNSVFGAQLLLFAFIAGIYINQQFIYSNKPLINQNRGQAFTQLWKAVDKAYPYFEEKQIDWEAVYQEYEPKIQAAKTDGVYYSLIAEMMTRLEDAHTQLQSPVLEPPVYATVKSVGGIPVLDMVGLSAQAAGLSSRMVLNAVEDLPVEEAVQAAPVGYDNAATPQAKRIRILKNIMALPLDDGPLSVTVITLDGKQQEVLITKLPPSANNGNPSFPDQPVITWQKLDGNVGLIHVSRLSNRNGEDLVSRFDTALDELMSTDALVLDLRGNGGGNSIFADQIAGRFLREPFVYGYETYPVRLYSHAFRKSTSYQVMPRGKIYDGPLVILTDEYVMSSAEWLVGALKDSGRAVTIGRTTSGSTGNPMKFYLPGGGWVRYSTAAFYRPNGKLVEGVGYEVDIPVTWLIEEYLAGEDPDLNQALAWINQNP